ncbi:MAG: hypothetical protein N0E54_03880, partial [Candidatus Thiodiazotropha taylori]|nr:hypothetical protein [Candidatus Thiodiazotropha endolucinida]MCW4227867.1 hypothetical protein [Candidatus Thiodiazotropha taylori]
TPLFSAGAADSASLFEASLIAGGVNVIASVEKTSKLVSWYLINLFILELPGVYLFYCHKVVKYPIRP